MNEPTIRWKFDVHNSVVLSAEGADAPEHLLPIHFAGAALFCANTSPANRVVSVEDSPDGTTWTPVLVSTHANSGLLNVTVVGYSYVAVLFRTAQPYVRISVTPYSPEGVECWLVEYPPVARVTEYAYT